MSNVTPSIPTASAARNVEPDSNSDTDGYFSDYASLASSTTSIGSSVFDYQYENGRRYHAYRAGQYLLPNDDQEQDRLDMTHHIFRLALRGELCVTKLEHPQRILDVGTGTGIWALEMGDQYPSAEIIGTDLSPIQPVWVPPNVRFEVDDARDEWTFAENHFDFINARTLAGSILDWPKFLALCYRHLRPGGKIEIAEGRANFWCDDGTMPRDSFTAQWLTEFNRLGQVLGLQFDVFPSMTGYLAQLPFTDIKTTEKPVPVGPWAKDKTLKELGRFFLVQFLEMGLEAYTLALFTRNGWSDQEVQVLLAKVRGELKSGKMHLYTFCSFVTATKPTV